MSIPEEKLLDLIKRLSEKDKEEAINFVEYLNEKRRKAIIDSFENAPVDESDEFSEEEIKEMIEKADNESGIEAEEVYKKLGLL